MGIFQQAPLPFVGGSQPCAGKKGVAFSGWSVDNPPYSHPGRPGTKFYAILLAWISPPPMPQAGIKGAAPSGWSVDNPPFKHGGKPGPEYYGIISLWQPFVPTPQSLRYLVQEGVIYVPDNPPFGLRNPLWPILSAWQPEFQRPQRSKVNVSTPGWSVDNPPFVFPLRGGPELGIIFQWWNISPPQPQARKLSVAFPGWSVDWVRPSRNIFQVIETWRPVFILPQARIYFPPPPVIIPGDNPPFGIPSKNFFNILRMWDPPSSRPVFLKQFFSYGGSWVAPAPWSVRQRIMDSLDVRLKGIVLSGSDSIRQQMMGALDVRLKSITSVYVGDSIREQIMGMVDARLKGIP